MYHYVRPRNAGLSGKLKFLDIECFKRQLTYLQMHYNFVTTNEILGSVENNFPLPPNACWLTFDDGYIDHYKHVFPELRKRNIEGGFFIPARAIEHREALQVNLIQHILAASDSVHTLQKELDSACIDRGITANELSEFKRKYAVANRFDDSTTIYVKRMLQHALPHEIRSEIVEKLFISKTGLDTHELADSLYMTTANVRELISAGMHVGSHGSNHLRMDQLPYAEQETDLSQSFEFLEKLGKSSTIRTISYPWGAFNSNTLVISRNLGVKIGVTTAVKIADTEKDDQLTLPRLDTMDFPT